MTLETQAMHYGEKLGFAIKEAMERKGVGTTEVGRAFGVKAPSVDGWIKTGRIHKKHLDHLVAYFADVAGPEHWGRSGNPADWGLGSSRQLAAHEPANNALGVQSVDGALELIDRALRSMDLAEREKIAQLFRIFAISPGETLMADLAALLREGLRKKSRLHHQA